MAVQTIYLTSTSQWTNPVDYVGVNVVVMPNIGTFTIAGHVHKDEHGNGGNFKCCLNGNNPTCNIQADGAIEIVTCSQGGGGEQ